MFYSIVLIGDKRYKVQQCTLKPQSYISGFSCWKVLLATTVFTVCFHLLLNKCIEVIESQKPWPLLISHLLVTCKEVTNINWCFQFGLAF